MQAPEYFTISPNSQTGDVYGTEFQLQTILPLEYKYFAWSLGNNTFVYNQRNISQTYDYPGLYTVSMSAWTDDGTYIVDSADIIVDYVYRDSLYFSQLPSSYGTPGLPSSEPFVVSVVSAKINEPISVVLQAFNTKSVPHYAVPEKWRFLTPTWKFVDAITNQTLDGPLILNTVPIYKDSKIVAVSGEASFYYIDSLSTGTDLNNSCPLLLAATLSTENFVYPPESLRYPYYSYSNSEVSRAVIAWQINDVIPTKLKVTENFLNDIYPVKWSNIPIPVMVTCQFDSTALEGFQTQELTDVLAYPRTNEFGSISPVTLLLSSNTLGIITDPTLYKADELYFQAFDSNNNVTSGYVFGTITPLTSFEDSTLVVMASTIATNQAEGTSSFAFPDGYPLYPNVYISHPFESNINRINIVTYPADCENINYYKNLGLLIEGTASFVSVPTTQEFDLSRYSLSGTTGVYGMAFNPFINKLYAADADQDKIHILNGGTSYTSSLLLSTYTGDPYNVPSCLAIDRFHNVWCSLYGSSQILKFDFDLNFTFSATVTSIGTPLYPPMVETDFNNDIWVCYAHSTMSTAAEISLSSTLVKFTNGGQEVFRTTNNELELSSLPVSLALNQNNEIWVACYNSNKLNLYSSDGMLLSSVGGIIHPSYIAVDRSSNIWCTHGYNFCSVLDTSTGQWSHWKFTTFPVQVVESVTDYLSADIEAAMEENEIWGGLAVDVYNRVWAIDSEQNTVYAFNPNNPTETFRGFELVPTAETNYVVIGGTNYVSQISDLKVRSAQAAGDWTGNRWYQKYTGGFNSLSIVGVSAPFQVFDIDNSFQIAKVNEEFDCAAYFRSLALPEVLNQNERLFDEFLAALVGDGNPTKESIGRVAYERIANFINNHGDLETADIDQLLSFAEQLSVPAKTFGVEFPAEVERLLNLFSTPKHRLRGLPNFQADIASNVGQLLTESSLVSASQYVFAKDRIYENYRLVYITTLQDGTEIYPLSALENILPSSGFRPPIFENYYFFEYNEEQTGYKGNIINWDSDYTTVDYTLSSNSDWYGDDGLVEKMFNNLLTRTLIDY